MANKMADKKKQASQSELVEPKERAGEKEQKSVKAMPREERRARDNKPARREVKQPAVPAKKGGFRNWRAVRFMRESYQELRYKVTWPTFEEARNMTFIVIALSAALSIVLGLADIGLFKLFQLISGK